MKNCALLIVDLQNAYFNNGQLAEQKQKLVEKCNELIDLCHANNMPVFNVRTEHARARATWTLNMLDDKQGYLFTGDKDLHEITLEVLEEEYRQRRATNAQIAKLIARSREASA
jgi:nicotinamidase-related amidase